ncbi:hypothetical protein G6F61_015214 [Rhizopus arrhizus]|nr:hypothetical protein G6F61_015214 [Rhizopus arrhizus]
MRSTRWKRPVTIRSACSPAPSMPSANRVNRAFAPSMHGIPRFEAATLAWGGCWRMSAVVPQMDQRIRAAL